MEDRLKGAKERGKNQLETIEIIMARMDGDIAQRNGCEGNEKWLITFQ